MNDRVAEDVHLRIVGLLLLLGAVSFYLLWTLDPVSQASQAVFALFLGVDLLSFAMISYVYRVDKRGDAASRVLLLAGCTVILILLFAGIVL